jgi:hypothetical protein
MNYALLPERIHLQKTNMKLNTLVSLDVLSNDNKGNYEVIMPKDFGGQIINPVLKGKTLYFVKLNDAVKVKKLFYQSLLCEYSL